MEKGKKILSAAALPVIVLAVCLLITSVNGITLFDSQLSWITFTRAAVNVLLVTYALSINLNSGRFDFSIGSTALLSSVISAMIATKYNLSPVLMLMISVVTGGLLGLLSGFVYVTVKLPPIIVSLAMALFYEGMAFTLTGGHGVSFASNAALMEFGTIPNFLIIAAIAAVMMIAVFDHTKFGYEYKALVSGQKVAVNTGIREVPNALICYLIAGLLMGAQGFISATSNGSITMSLNFGSISPMFMAFLPMFVGGFIGRFINDKFGYLLGAVCSALISLVYVRMNAASSTQQIVSALLMVSFLIYLNNEGKLKHLLKRS
jgi:ribose transport system permease protein